MPTGIQLSSGVVVGQPIPLDAKFGPYDSVALALADLSSGYRYQGLTVGIKSGSSVVEYWFKNGVADTNFAVKASVSSVYILSSSTTPDEFYSSPADSLWVAGNTGDFVVLTFGTPLTGFRYIQGATTGTTGIRIVASGSPSYYSSQIPAGSISRISYNGGGAINTTLISRVDHGNIAFTGSTSLPIATTSVNGLMTGSDKTKLNGIAAGAEVNVNADWNATAGDEEILNKPALPFSTYKGDYDNGALYGVGDVVSTPVGSPYGEPNQLFTRVSNPGNPGYAPGTSSWSSVFVADNDPRIVNIRANSITNVAGVSVDVNGDPMSGIGGNGGVLNLDGGNRVEGRSGGNAGNINLQGGWGADMGTNGANGGSIISIGANGVPTATGGSLNMSGWSNNDGESGFRGGNITTTGSSERAGGDINTSSGGSINTSGEGGGSIRTDGGDSLSPSGSIDTRGLNERGGSIETWGNEGAGGSINTSDGGGSINTRGSGTLELGALGTRTTLTGSAAGADKVISFPNASGTVALTSHSHAAATTTAAGFLSTTDKTKLDGIASGAEVNVNADWNATSGDAQILNKPVLSGVVTDAFPSGFGNGAANINWAAASYWSGSLGMAGGTTIAFQNVIVGKTITLDIGNSAGYLLAWPSGITWVGGSAPTPSAIRVRILATSATQFIGYADTRLASSASYTDLVGVPATFTPTSHTHPISDVTDLQTALNGKAAFSHTHSASQITNAPVELVIACSDETSNLTVGANKVTFRAPYAFTLLWVRASVNTAPTGSALIVDINKGGTSVLSTKLSIDASEKTSTTAALAAVISNSAIEDDAEITIDIDPPGPTIAGKGLKVVLIGTRA